MSDISSERLLETLEQTYSVKDFVAFDIETTGRIADKDDILEIGAVRFVNGRSTESFETLIDPMRPIPTEATRIHGITDQMVRGKPQLRAALESFNDFSANSVLVAHNATFDVKFLQAAVTKLLVKAPPGPILDTYPMSKVIFPDLMNHRLISLVKHLKIKAQEFHRAKQDSAYCGKLLVAMIKQLSSGGKLPSLGRLIELSNGYRHLPQVDPQPVQLGLFS